MEDFLRGVKETASETTSRFLSYLPSGATNLNERVVDGNLELLKAEAAKKHQLAEQEKVKADRERREAERRAVELAYYEERDGRTKDAMIKQAVTEETRKLMKETAALEKAKIDGELEVVAHRVSKEAALQEERLCLEENIFVQQEKTEKTKARALFDQRVRQVSEVEKAAAHERNLADAQHKQQLKDRKQVIRHTKELQDIAIEEEEAAKNVARLATQRNVEHQLNVASERWALESEIQLLEISKRRAEEERKEKRRRLEHIRVLDDLRLDEEGIRENLELNKSLLRAKIALNTLDGAASKSSK